MPGLVTAPGGFTAFSSLFDAPQIANGDPRLDTEYMKRSNGLLGAGC